MLDQLIRSENVLRLLNLTLHAFMSLNELLYFEDILFGDLILPNMVFIPFIHIKQQKCH
jgi:hypothetical protein